MRTVRPRPKSHHSPSKQLRDARRKLTYDERMQERDERSRLSSEAKNDVFVHETVVGEGKHYSLIDVHEGDVLYDPKIRAGYMHPSLRQSQDAQRL